VNLLVNYTVICVTYVTYGINNQDSLTVVDFLVNYTVTYVTYDIKNQPSLTLTSELVS